MRRARARRSPRPVTIAAAVVAAAAIAVLGFADIAAAHDPLIVDNDQGTPTRPLIEDGTVSFATYGVIDRPGGSATVRLRFTEGQEIYLQLLVPDRAPESTHADFSHMGVTITPPSGEGAGLVAGPVTSRFSEEFSHTDYLVLLEHTQPAEAGVTEITVTSALPTRFTLATGRTEQFGTAVSDYTRRPFSELAAWYATPPPEVPGATTAPPAADPTTGAGSAPAPPATAPPAPATTGSPAASIDRAATSTKAPAGRDGDGGDASERSPWLVGAGVAAAVAVAAVAVAAIARRSRPGPAATATATPTPTAPAPAPAIETDGPTDSVNNGRP